MLLGRFLGVMDENLGRVYVVVKCPTEEEAIKIANRHFKIKSDRLTTKRVYLSNTNSDEFSFAPSKGWIAAWAVYKK